VPSGSGQIENLRIAAGQLNAALSNRVRDLGSIDKGIILSGVMDYDRCAVIMFTKDNADRLRITLPQFSDKPVRTILLDDSTTDDTQRLFASRFGQTNIEYHGRTQQDAVLAQMEQRLGEFITPLGTPRWHLGNCRNYAVWLALSRNLERVILIDDDILLSDSAQVLATLNLLSQFPLIGAKTIGMPDDSVVGHVLRGLGAVEHDFISGQYLGLALDRISFHFPDVYDEDWIFLLLHSLELPLARYGTVTQLYYDPFGDMEAECLFQEPGEILVEGLIDAIVMYRRPSLLFEEVFWRKIVFSRKSRITEIEGLLRERPDGRELLHHHGKLAIYHEEVDPRTFAKWWRGYFEANKIWRQILASRCE